MAIGQKYYKQILQKKINSIQEQREIESAIVEIQTTDITQEEFEKKHLEEIKKVTDKAERRESELNAKLIESGGHAFLELRNITLKDIEENLKVYKNDKYCWRYATKLEKFKERIATCKIEGEKKKATKTAAAETAKTAAVKAGVEELAAVKAAAAKTAATEATKTAAAEAAKKGERTLIGGGKSKKNIIEDDLFVFF